jgi:hypothetical protein
MSRAALTEGVLEAGNAVYTPGVSEKRGSVTTFSHSGLKNAGAQTDAPASGDPLEPHELAIDPSPDVLGVLAVAEGIAVTVLTDSIGAAPGLALVGVGAAMILQRRPPQYGA